LAPVASALTTSPPRSTISNIYSVKCKTDLSYLIHWMQLDIFAFYDDRGPEDDTVRSKHVSWIIINWTDINWKLCWRYQYLYNVINAYDVLVLCSNIFW
jgi:hypothetical protein